MKRIKILMATLLFPVFTFAQGIEIVPFAGYMFGGSIKFVEGKLNASDGLDYGVSLLVPLHEFLDVEVNYSRMEGEVRFDPYLNYTGPPWNLESEKTGVSTNYFQLGVISAFTKQNPNIVPFGSFSLGATLFSLDEYADTWRFSITAGLGAKFMFSEHIGVMLRGRLMLPMTFAGVGGYCGVGTGGSGCGLSVNSWATIVQGDFNAGLIIKLGN